MKRNFFFAGAIVLLALSCKQAGKLSAPANAADLYKSEGYELVWADEFNTDGPDTANWRYERGFVRNQEHQWYQTENAFCNKGLLIIEARRERKLNPDFDKGSKDWKKNRQFIDYTSSSINTSKKHSWQYGRFVMRGRIDVSAGLWPAWWTLGVSGRWPSNGEIDIMEYYRNKLLFNVACGTSLPNKAEWHSTIISIDSVGGAAWAEKFHVWRMDWDEKAIELFLDDKLMNRVDLYTAVNKDGSNFNPFKQPHYMLLDLAVGGMNGGDPSATNFPRKFEVDYVRVYQKR